MTDPRSFGAWLRRERERRSVTVRSIADRTKVGAGLLEALERGDVSRWPGGIYRRAFVRSYAEAVGLDGDLVVANFERVFPADPLTAPPASRARLPHAEREEMRLSLVTPTVAGLTTAALKTACLDVACILGFGLGGLAAAGAVGFWCAAAVAAVVFHLSRTLGRLGRIPWSWPEQKSSAVQPRAEVLNFAEEQARSTSRRARARRALAGLSAAATSAALPGRRRAARS